MRDMWGSEARCAGLDRELSGEGGMEIVTAVGMGNEVPANFDLALIGRSLMAQDSRGEKDRGAARADGVNFSAPGADAFIMVPQGLEGPTFLVTHNFMAVMAYNESHSYAVAVGHLAGWISGQGPFVA